jgi:hypothetical protein
LCETRFDAFALNDVACGRDVIVQQPSAEIFFRFDQLLLLKRGGEVVYFGSVQNRSRPLVQYLSALCESPLPRNTNPANWMLEVTGAFVHVRTCRV